MAHGRVSALSPNDSLHLIKFGKPFNGKSKVRVVFNEILSQEYLDQQIKCVFNAITIVKEKLYS